MAEEDRTRKFESLLAIPQDVVETLEEESDTFTEMVDKALESQFEAPSAGQEEIENPTAGSPTPFTTTLTPEEPAQVGTQFVCTAMAEMTAVAGGVTNLTLEILWGSETLGSVALGAAPAANDFLYVEVNVKVASVDDTNGVVVLDVKTVADNGGVQAAAHKITFDEGFDTDADISIVAAITMAGVTASGDTCDLRQLTIDFV